MYIKMEIESFWWLENNCWSGALDRLKEIRENGLEDEFMDYLQMYFDMGVGEEIPTMTELNDFIWFDLDGGSSAYVSGNIADYEHLEGEFYLLIYRENGIYGIVNSWKGEDMEIAYGRMDPESIEIDWDEDIIYYSIYEHDHETNQDVLKRRKIRFDADESDWEYAEDEEENEEAMEMEPSLSTESKNNFINNFKYITEKLNNIQKRNLPTIYD